METNLFVSIVMVICLLFGAFLGAFLSKIKRMREDRKLVKNAQEVIDGKRENSITIDGQKYDANKFRTRDDDGNEIITELQGGVQTKNEKQEENFKEEDYNYGKANVGSEGEGSSSSREGQRTSREEKRDSRGFFKRIRRFG